MANPEPTSDASSSLVRESAVPLYHQLYSTLREQILRGLYANGTAIPNEIVLGELFKVSRVTVRRAVAALEEQGFVEKKQGHGTFVRNTGSGSKPVATLGYVESLKHQLRNTDVKVLTLETVIPPGPIALQLQLAPTASAVRSLRLRLSGGIPLLVSEVWVPVDIGARITKQELRKLGIYEILSARGVKFERVVQEISALSAGTQMSTLLEVPQGSPLLRVTRLLYGNGMHPVQHTTLHMAPERSRVLMDVATSALDAAVTGHIAHDGVRPRK